MFPALMRSKEHEEADITHLANLCHNCRGCYYACQYTAPHEFDLNLPAALAKTRSQSWEKYIWPGIFASAFQKNGLILSVLIALTFGIFLFVIRSINVEGAGFYAYLSHALMVTIFLPAFILPLVVIAVGLVRYVKDTLGRWPGVADMMRAKLSAARMDNLSGGQGQGCNYEKKEQYSLARKYAHQSLMWGFVLCFASTASGTVLHYGFDMPAPYPFWSFPKLFGVSGGVLMTLGAAALIFQKTKADVHLGDINAWGGEKAFIWLCLLVALTGLLLYWIGGAFLLALHLGFVFSFFVTMPYSKFIHVFFRLAALAVESAKQRDG